MSLRVPLILTLALLVTGCSFSLRSLVYRPPVAQGNLITSEMMGQVELGMSASQVHYLLGEPTLRDPFHKNRWDYSYYFNPRFGGVQLRHVAVFFDAEDRLIRIESDELPNEREANALVLGQKIESKRKK